MEAALTHQSRRFFALWLKEQRNGRLMGLQRLAESLDVTVRSATREHFEQHCPDGVHQGVLLECGSRAMKTAPPLPKPEGTAPFYLVLDQVSDPQNLGAILRSAAFFGAAGCVVCQDHSPGLTPIVSKASVGVAEWFPVYVTTNLARFLELQKAEGFWVVGMTGEGTEKLNRLQRDRPLLVVLGNEGKGLRRLVQQHCDWEVQIQGDDQVESLNVSTAAALVGYQLYRQAGEVASASLGLATDSSLNLPSS